MAALTADRLVDVKAFDNMQGGWVISYPVAVDVVYKGGYVQMTAAGFLEPATAAASTFFVGLALQTVDNSAGSAGDLSCKVLVGAVVQDNIATLPITSVGDRVYLEDDQTPTLVLTANSPMGRVMAVIAVNGACLIKMQTPDIALGA